MNIPRLLQAYEGRLTFEPKGVPMFRMRYKKCGVIEKDEALLLGLSVPEIVSLARRSAFLLSPARPYMLPAFP